MRNPVLFKQAQRGFNLIEMLISMALGIVIITGVLSFFTGSVRSNTENMLNARLTQELRAVTEIMTQEIQRAGYWSNAGLNPAGSVVNNPFGIDQVAVQGAANSPASDCILYSYDSDNNAGASATDFRGFRLNANAIQWLRGASNNNCNDGVWDTITTTNMITVTAMTIQEVPQDDGSFGCYNLTTDANCDPCSNDNWAIGHNLTDATKITITINAQYTLGAGNTKSMQISETVQVRNADTGTATAAGPDDDTTFCGRQLPLNTLAVT